MLELALEPVGSRTGVGVSAGDQSLRASVREQQVTGRVIPIRRATPGPAPGLQGGDRQLEFSRDSADDVCGRVAASIEHDDRRESVRCQRLRGQGSKAALDALRFVTCGDHDDRF